MKSIKNEIKLNDQRERLQNVIQNAHIRMDGWRNEPIGYIQLPKGRRQTTKNHSQLENDPNLLRNLNLRLCFYFINICCFCFL